MPHDYLKKEPTKTEKLIYELFRHQDDMARSLWSTSSFATALAYLLKADPQKVAELLTSDHEKVKEYSDKVNKAIQEIEAKRKMEEESKSAQSEQTAKSEKPEEDK